jgi:ABC-type nitrate/sulfonate/bicarbonate transport system permease component
MTPRVERVVWRLLPAVPALLVLLAWWVWFAIDRPPASVMPSAWDVVVTMFELAVHGRLPGDIAASLGRLLSGVAVGVGSGIVAGFVAGLNRPVANFLNPLVVFFNAISGIVWLPLVIGWLGIGGALAIFLIWNTVFFIVFQNTVLGVQLVPEVLEQGVLSLGGGRWETIRSVILPGALPYILTGVRSGMGFGWRALIAAELVGATTGLGQLIFNGAEYHRADVIVGGCLLIGAIAMAMDRWLLLPIERRTVVRWGLMTTGSSTGRVSTGRATTGRASPGRVSTGRVSTGRGR